jgi:hypothetical protein
MDGDTPEPTADADVEAERRELDALRARAYGPDADISDDPIALARLRQLEERSRPAPLSTAPVHPTEGSATADPAFASGSPSLTGPTSADPPPSRSESREAEASAPPAAAASVPPSRRMSWHTSLVVAVAAVSAVVAIAIAGGGMAGSGPAASPTPSAIGLSDAVRHAFAFSSDPSTPALERIYVGTPPTDAPRQPAGTVPTFPTVAPIAWVEPLGIHYGSRLWVAKSTSGEACLLLATDEHHNGECVDESDFAGAALLVTLPYADIPQSERPAAMTPSQAIAFWWLPDETVLVLLGWVPDAHGAIGGPPASTE